MDSRNGHSAILDSSGRPFEIMPERDLRPAYDSSDPNLPFDGFGLPHVLSFSALFNTAFRTYLHDQWDEAMRKSREAALVTRRDLFLQALLQERKLATASLKWHIEVDDEKQPVQKAVKDALQTMVRRIPLFGQLRYYTLNSIWFGRYGANLKWGWKQGPFRKELHVTGHLPINGDKIGHQFDHTPYVLINAAYMDKIQGAETIWTTLGPAAVLRSRSWRERVLICTHEMDDSDFFSADEAERVHGVGVRDKIFFYQWFKLEFLAAISDYFQRFGLGVNVWHFDPNNPSSLAECRKGAKEFSGKTNMFVPISADMRGRVVGGVERIETPVAGVEAMKTHLIDYVDRSMERFIAGQSMSGGKDAGDGLGGTGRAEFAADTKHQITKFDASNHAEALSGSEEVPGIVSTMHKYTFPETFGKFGARLVYDLDDPQAKEKLEAVVSAAGIGVDFIKDEVRALTGLGAPKEGDETVGGKDAMMAGLGLDPEGKPMAPPDKPGDAKSGKDKPKKDKPPDKPAAYSKDGEPLPYAFDPSQPRDEAGKWTAVTSALKAAHPLPTEVPPNPPGMGSPKALAEDPKLRAAAEVYGKYAAAHNRAFIADVLHNLLSKSPPKPPRGTGQAIDRVGESGLDLSMLGSAFDSHLQAVAASHPQGGEAVEAARPEARRRYEEAVQAAEALIAALPPEKRARAERALERSKREGAAQ